MSAGMDLIGERTVAYMASPEFAMLRQEWVCEVLGRVIDRMVGIDRQATMALLCDRVEQLGAGGPELASLIGVMRSDASFWAECASEIELETYAAAALREIQNRAFAIKARKRLLVMLWTSLTDDDRRAFLRGVDPNGLFSRRAA